MNFCRSSRCQAFSILRMSLLQHWGHKSVFCQAVPPVSFSRASFTASNIHQWQPSQVLSLDMTPTTVIDSMPRTIFSAPTSHTVVLRRGFHGTPVREIIPKSRALTLIQDLKEVKDSPAPALTLGFLGLIPFVTAPAYMIFSQCFWPMLAYAQVAYGATILSFLGGVRWGLTLPEEGVVKPDWKNLGYSVTPSLVAWVGLLLPPPFSLLTVMGGLGVAAYFDTAMFGYPMWFKGLRFILSFIAVLSLWTTFVCKYLLKDRQKNVNDIDVPTE